MTTITDTLYSPKGELLTGELVIELNVATGVAGGETYYGRERVAIGTDGALSVDLVPNSTITPSGTYYRVTRILRPVGASTRDTKTETVVWVVPDTGTATVADVETLSTPTTTATYLPSQISTSGATSGQVLKYNGTTVVWSSDTGITSVALSLPAIFSVSGSPLTSNGTLTVTLATQTANTVWAGPTTGSAAAPTFRSLVAADIPSALTTASLQPSADGTSAIQLFKADGTSPLLRLDTTNERLVYGKTISASFSSLVELRTKQTVTTSGNQDGRGAIRLYDRVASGSRILELGYYQYGAGLFYSGGSGTDPFEFWIDSGILSLKGNSLSNTTNRLEIRTPSDASGLNFEAPYYKGTVAAGTLGGHIYYDLATYPLFFHVEDGTGFSMEPQGVWRFGGGLLNASYLSPVVHIQAGDTSQTAALALGRYTTGGGNTALFWWKMGSNQRFAQLGYGAGAIDTNKSMVMTDDGRFAIGVDNTGALARFLIKSNETSIPTLTLQAVTSQTGNLQTWLDAAGTTTVAAMTTAGALSVASLTAGTTAKIGTSDGSTYAVLWTTTNHPLYFGANGVTAFNLNAARTLLDISGVTTTAVGKLAVGQTSATYAVDITGAGAQAIRINSTNNDASVFLSVAGTTRWQVTANSSTDFELYNNYKTARNLVVLAASGSVGVGLFNTSPTGTLHVCDATATTGATKLTVRAGAGQSSTALQEWLNNSNGVLAYVSSTGFGSFSGIGLNGNSATGVFEVSYIGGYGLRLQNVTYTTATQNGEGVVRIIPTYNQTGVTGAANTDLYINRTETSLGTTPGAQYLINAAVGGVSKFSVLTSGTVYSPGLQSQTSQLSLGNTNYALTWASNLTTNGNNQNDIGSASNPFRTGYFGTSLNAPLVQFGGTTSSFPAIKRNGAVLDFRLADDSGYANISAAAGSFTGNVSTTANPGQIAISFGPSMFFDGSSGNAGFGSNMYHNGTNWVFGNTTAYGGKGLAWSMFPGVAASLKYAANGANPATVTDLLTILPSGNVGIGPSNNTPSSTAHIYDATATTGVTKLTVRAGAGQSSTALQEWLNNSSTVLASVRSDGTILTPGGGSASQNNGWGLNYYASGLQLGPISLVTWGATNQTTGYDIGLARNAAGILDVNSGTAIGTTPGNARDLRLRNCTHIETSTDPSASDLTIAGSNAQDCFRLYMKNDKLVVAYNRSGTVTYLTVPLDGATTSWTQSTTAP